MSYAEYQVQTAPTWLQRAWGVAWSLVVGTIKDGVQEAAKVAVKARFAAVAPADALPLLLRDYVLDPPYNETDATSRRRLLAAWSTWKSDGTRAGIVAALNAAGFGNVVVQENITPGRWWDFRVLLRPPLPWDYALLPLYTWGSGRTWGSGARWVASYPSRADRDRVIAIIKKWKPSHANLVSVTVQVAGPYWGSFAWGDGTAFGGVEDQWS